jgi:hypothetical protein
MADADELPGNAKAPLLTKDCRSGPWLSCEHASAFEVLISLETSEFRRGPPVGDCCAATAARLCSDRCGEIEQLPSSPRFPKLPAHSCDPCLPIQGRAASRSTKSQSLLLPGQLPTPDTPCTASTLMFPDNIGKAELMLGLSIRQLSHMLPCVAQERSRGACHPKFFTTLASKKQANVTAELT